MLSIPALNSSTLLSVLELLENECGIDDLLDEDTNKDSGKKNKLNQNPEYSCLSESPIILDRMKPSMT